MSLDPAYLEYRLSGGAANTDPDASLGGAMSSEVVHAQVSSISAPFSGVTILTAYGNNTGTGTFDYLHNGGISREVLWAASGSTSLVGEILPDFSEQVRVSVYSSEGGVLVLDVDTSLLPGADTSANPLISNVFNQLFDDITRQESWQGDTEYRCLYVTNADSSAGYDSVKIWVAQDAAGLDSVQIGPGVKNVQAPSIADEQTAPAGVTFGTYINEPGAISVGSLAAGDFFPIWIKRTVPAESIIGTSNDNFAISAQVF